MEKENEDIDSTTNDNDEDIDNDIDNDIEKNLDNADDGNIDADALAEKNKNLFARAKKAEAELKKLKAEKVDSSKTVEAKDTSSEYLTKDEAVLIAKGMDLEEMDQLKLIQKGMGGTLKEALESPLYQGYVKQREAEEKRKKAQLGASGSGGEKEDDPNRPGLSAEEHRKIWEDSRK